MTIVSSQLLAKTAIDNFIKTDSFLSKDLINILTVAGIAYVIGDQASIPSVITSITLVYIETEIINKGLSLWAERTFTAIDYIIPDFDTPQLDLSSWI